MRFVTIAILVAFAAPSPAQTREGVAFQDVKQGHWAYAEMAALHKAGLKMAYIRPGNARSPLYTRYEFALSIDRCLYEVGVPSNVKATRRNPAHRMTPRIAASLLRLIKE